MFKFKLKMNIYSIWAAIIACTILLFLWISYDIKCTIDPLYNIKKQEIISGDIRIRMTDYNTISLYEYNSLYNTQIKIKDIKID